MVESAGWAKLLFLDVDLYQLVERGNDPKPALDRRLGTLGLPCGL
jgi:hypothetical protein